MNQAFLSTIIAGGLTFIFFLSAIAQKNTFNVSAPADSIPVAGIVRNISDSALLDIVQRQTFRYFWHYAHPVSGLAR